MSRRIVLAVLLSFLIHWGLLKMDFSKLARETVAPQIKQILVTMAYLEPAKQPERRKDVPLPPKPAPKRPKPIRTTALPPKPAPPAEPPPKTVQPPTPETIKESVATETEQEEPLQETRPPAEPVPSEPPAAKAVVQARPAYKKNPPPVYPKVARRRGHKGTVVLAVKVGKSGDVKELHIQQSSGYPVLDDAALESVKNWLFEAGTVGGQKVEMWVELPIRFELQ